MRRMLLVALGYATATTAIAVATGVLSLPLLVTIILVAVAIGTLAPPPRQDPMIVVVEVSDENMDVTQFVVPVLIPAGCDEDEKCTAAFMVQNALPLPPDAASLVTRWRDA